MVANSKKIALAVLGTAAQKFTSKLEQEQMVLCWAADIIIESYLMDSTLGRTAKMVARDGVEKHEYAVDATRLYIHDAISRIETAAKNALASTVEGDELGTLLAALRRFTKYTPINTSAMRERLADKVVEAGVTFSSSGRWSVMRLRILEIWLAEKAKDQNRNTEDSF